MDLAGNVGERSEAVCLDKTAPHNPITQLEELRRSATLTPLHPTPNE